MVIRAQNIVSTSKQVGKYEVFQGRAIKKNINIYIYIYIKKNILYILPNRKLIGVKKKISFHKELRLPLRTALAALIRMRRLRGGRSTLSLH